MEAWEARGDDHFGIIFCKAPPAISYGEILRRLLNLLDGITAEEMVNQIEWLDHRWSGSPSSKD